MKHPAKFSDVLLPTLRRMVGGSSRILDPFAGVGKIGLLKTEHNTIYANELEPEWITPNVYRCDYITIGDAEFLPYEDGLFDCVCTSPTYGNRMADCHNAKDASQRNTYTHSIGRTLSDANTGKMQWGKCYRDKHRRIYRELSRVLACNGLLIINVSNHIRKGVEIDVTAWHKNTILDMGFVIIEDSVIETTRNRFGKNGNIRVNGEHIMMFRKI